MKKALSFILTVALLLTSVVFILPVNATTEAETTAPATPTVNTTATGLWSDFAATSFAGGVVFDPESEEWGTAENPYQISTAAELAYLAVLCNTFDTTKEFTHGISLPNMYQMAGLYFELTADIDLSAHAWVPIAKTYSAANYNNWPGVYETIVYEVEKDAEGKDKVDADGNPVYKLDAEGNKIIDTAKSKKGKQTRQWSFNGTFDGKGFKITGLTFNEANLQADGTVGPEYGSLALFGCVRNPGVVKNLYVESSVEIDGWMKVANAETGEMERVPAGTDKAGTFKFMTSNFAGTVAVIAGGSYGGTFENITINAYRKMQGHNANEILNTGFVGYATWNGANTYTTIKNCVAYGELSTHNAIEAATDAEITRSGMQPMTSAFVGRAGGACIIEDCTNYANIWQNTKNTNCIASAFVGKTNMNGNSSKRERGEKELLYMENCVNYGDVYVENFKGSSSNTRAGAFVGNAGRGNNKGDVLMLDCINYGDIGASFAGGSSGISSLIGLTEAAVVEAYYCFSYTQPHLDDAEKVFEIMWEPSLITNAGGGTRMVNGVTGTVSGKYTEPTTCAFIDEGVNTPIVPVEGGRLLLNPEDPTTANLRLDFNIGDDFWNGFVGNTTTLEMYVAYATQAEMDKAATAANSTKATDIIAELTKEGSTYDYELIEFKPDSRKESVIYAALRNLSDELTVGVDEDGDGEIDEGTSTVVNEYDQDYVAVAYMKVTNPYTNVEYLYDTDYTVGDAKRVGNVYNIATIYYNDFRYDAQNEEGTYYEISEDHLLDGKGTYSYFENDQLDVIKGYLPEDAE